MIQKGLKFKVYRNKPRKDVLYTSGMDKHTAATYDEIADAYADLQDKKPWNRYFERPETLAFLPDVRSKAVLDASCGPGFYAHYMMEQGARVTAFDYYPGLSSGPRPDWGRGQRLSRPTLQSRLSSRRTPPLTW